MVKLIGVNKGRRDTLKYTYSVFISKPRAQSYQQKNSQNSDKILRFLTISTDFQIVFLSKFSEENIQKSVQPAAPKYFELVRETESGGPKK